MSLATPRLRLAVLLTLGVLLLGGAGAAYAVQYEVFGIRTADVAEAIRGRLALPSADELSDGPSVQPVGELAAVAAGLHPGVVEVYAARDAQPLWMRPAAREAALALLAGADADGLDPAAFGVVMLAEAARRPASDTSLATLDLALTSALLRLGDALVAPRADAHALYGRHWFPTTRHADPAARLTAAVASPETDAAEAVQAWADGLRPQHPGYRALRAVLVRETALARRPALVLSRDLAPGDTGRAVAALAARLAIEAEIAGEPAPEQDTRQFDAALSAVLVAVQTRAGVPPTGRLDGATRAWLNRRQTEALPLVRLNLERWRWLPDTLGALHVWANLPAFEIVVREQAPSGGWTDALVSRAVVGQRSWKTPVFSDTMESVVFNPTWRMPASIQIEAYGRLRPDRALRQPGPGNALGRVKFLFPNPHAVYIHDTPSKWAFTVADRARSHGCVRAGDPRDLAVALLTRTNNWTVEQVDEVVTGPWRLQAVKLDRPVPVHLVYFTASADAAGRVHLLNDVYGHDAALAEALGLSLDGVPPAPTPEA